MSNTAPEKGSEDPAADEHGSLATSRPAESGNNIPSSPCHPSNTTNARAIPDLGSDSSIAAEEVSPELNDFEQMGTAPGVEGLSQGSVLPDQVTESRNLRVETLGRRMTIFREKRLESKQRVQLFIFMASFFCVTVVMIHSALGPTLGLHDFSYKIVAAALFLLAILLPACAMAGGHLSGCPFKLNATIRKWPWFFFFAQLSVVLFSALATAVEWERDASKSLIVVVAAYCLYARASIVGMEEGYLRCSEWLLIELTLAHEAEP
jgi:hypothetical protein